MSVHNKNIAKLKELQEQYRNPEHVKFIKDIKKLSAHKLLNSLVDLVRATATSHVDMSRPVMRIAMREILRRMDN